MQSAVSALWVHGGCYDILGLAGVLLRELGDGGLQVGDFVDAGEVKNVVDFVGGERGSVCGSHACCVYVCVGLC